jgi:putative lipoic acid-binding regulatory protein
MKDRERFYEKLKTQLDETTNFPNDYLYKFIVAADGNKVEQVQKIFDNTGAVINTKKSKTGKYMSVSIVLKVSNSDQVIGYYKEAEKVEGIISL